MHASNEHVCAIGVFDGVHIGHQALLRATLGDAQERGATAVAVTFDRDPDELFCPDKVHKVLTNEERLTQLSLIVPQVVALPFTKELACQEWHEFLASLAARLPGLRAIHVGENFHCGAGAGGGIAEIAAWGKERGIDVVAEPLCVYEGTTVSASRIRAYLAEGDVRTAAALLTRPFALTGYVVSGAGRGQSLGFATANVKVAGSSAMMGPYVYAAYAFVGGVRYKAAVSIGDPPTFSSKSQEFNPFILEAHLIDLNADLYDKELRLEFVDKLRPMQRFEDPEVLVATIKENISWVAQNL
ncbi:MAG: riboflavin biosynthesis protein RibF [Coriobacteriia bacterium]|nr:riboflavin biosynthesis protein RibF [Coriobacteriia bacterium]